MITAIGFIGLAITLAVMGVVGLVFIAQDEIKANRRFKRRVSRRR